MSMQAQRGGEGIAPTPIHPSLGACGSSVSRFGPFTPSKNQIAVVQEADWGRCGQARKISTPQPAFDPRTVQPVRNPYTD